MGIARQAIDTTDQAGEPRPASLDARERLLAFAFAASDLLVEIDHEQRITFAAGAFRSRLGRPGDEYLGQPISRLVAAEDHAALETALAHLTSRGRLRPMGIRIADVARTPFVLAGLATGRGDRFCLTLGQLPAPLPEASPTAGGQESLLRVAEPRLREAAQGGAPAWLTLVEVEGLAEATVLLGHGARAELLDGIGAAIEHAAPGGAAGELGGGRWGLVHGGGLNAPGLARSIEALARARAPASAALKVAATDLSLDTEGSDQARAVRALRLLVSRFSEAGPAVIARAVSRTGEAGLRRFLDSLSTEASQIESAISRRRFRLAYQPVVRLDDRRVAHFEALIRPAAGVDGPLSDPHGFVTIAEALGFAGALDLAVIEVVSEALAAAPAAAAAVNISAISLSDPGFAGPCLDALGRATATPERLLIEVTETADIGNPDAAAALIAEFRRRGHAVCLDDFGAGAAGIRHLKRLSIDYVKIDGHFVRGGGGRDRALLTQIVQLCRASGARVIAEQIETESEAAMLAELGVEFGQGFLFGRPGHLPGLRS